uniref:Uncharacterized protein n=1 Tax=Glossina austeni TaxID=7395 RepID=A0A1A9VHH8_GLOAU
MTTTNIIRFLLFLLTTAPVFTVNTLSLRCYKHLSILEKEAMASRKEMINIVTAINHPNQRGDGGGTSISSAENINWLLMVTMETTNKRTGKEIGKLTDTKVPSSQPAKPSQAKANQHEQQTQQQQQESING